jgi:GTP-binding protein Era
VLLIVDSTRPRLEEETRVIIDGLKRSGRRAILALNKVDAVKRDKLLGLTQRLFDIGIFDEVFMISATTGDGTADLVKGWWRGCRRALALSDDQISDLSLRDIAAEITREHLFRQLRAELPYALTVEPETWEDFEDGSVRIGQQIFVQREGQRSIVLGEGGQKIKAVRLAAQPEIEALTERKVHLFLHVKVRENWPDDPERYRAMGLDYDS